jgi:hypothetical protein
MPFVAGAGSSVAAAPAAAGTAEPTEDAEFFVRQLRSHPAFDSKLAAKVKKAAKGYVGAHE